MLLAASQTAPILATALANFLTIFVEKFNPTKLVFFNKSLFFVASAFTLTQNTYLLIGARFLMGLSLGLQFPFCNLILYEATPKQMRGKTGNFISIFNSAGLMLGFWFSSLVNAQTISWRTFYLATIGIAFVDFLLHVFYLRNQLSVVDMFQRKVQEVKIRKHLSYYLSPKAVDHKLEESKQTCELISRGNVSVLNQSDLEKHDRLN